eukprot:CAMPEP_0168470484 /NCGR_PEP_ID=MMETSP0228-20121227/58752_1 /TAXON_ID=133427 /ORGANISM="Protoceratium reticulatum, Strain CCCM 535 (=CCMP 1889)" /LENGTH=743 /DNA_ID=CAMNT_0008486287 /DNA_START=17 /DNA_END=2248 /DNA_ORIENTATION=-
MDPPLKRPRVDGHGAEPQANAGGDALSLVVALLAAAGGQPGQASALTQALSLLGGQGGAPSAESPQALGEVGPEDAVHIPNSCVGWLKGRQGGMIRDIEGRSGASVDIDQSTKELGYSVVNVRGTPEQKKVGRGLVIAEVAKVMDQSGTPLDGHFAGSKEEFRIESQYVGWLKGPRGKVIQDLQIKSATRIEVDQSASQLGYATVKIFGTPEGVQQARGLVVHELSKIGPEAATLLSKEETEITAQADGLGVGPGGLGGSLSSIAGGLPLGTEDSVCIPNAYVGWLKGRQGGMIRDIEGRSGAQIDIDQSTKELGYSTTRMRGTPEQQRTARGLVIGEVAKVMDQSGEALDGTFPGFKEEFRIDSQYVGWLKGPKGKVVQDLQVKSATRIEVDQSQPQLGYATVKVFGTLEGIQLARELIAGELGKVSPEAAAHVTGQMSAGVMAQQDAQSQAAFDPNHAEVLRAAIMAMASAGGLQIPGLAEAASMLGAASSAPSMSMLGAAQPLATLDPSEVESVRIPNTCVGWLKGRQGAMIREIEARSGAQVDIDQSTRELGYSQANVRGAETQRRTAAGLVVAEIAKVMDQSGEVFDDTFPGCKVEFHIDSQYVGWLKGPRGKVVQDLQIKSATRIDVDQSNPQLGYATVKVYGDLQGTQHARALIAAELSKVNPEVAARVTGDAVGVTGGGMQAGMQGLQGLQGLPGGLQGMQELVAQAQAAAPSMQAMAMQQPLLNPQMFAQHDAR